MKTGKVYLIGAGPGDPGLLTLKGKRCLEEAVVVIYDYLVDQRILAYARPGAELIYVGKKSGGEAISQAEINQLMLERAGNGQVVARLIHHGLPASTPVALIRWGTRPDQEVLTGTVGTIAELAAERRFEPPAIAVVGEVVRLRERLRWFETKPLFSRRIVVTRPQAQASGFVELLEQQGAEVVLFPTIETVPLA